MPVNCPPGQRCEFTAGINGPVAGLKFTNANILYRFQILRSEPFGQNTTDGRRASHFLGRKAFDARFNRRYHRAAKKQTAHFATTTDKPKKVEKLEFRHNSCASDNRAKHNSPQPCFGMTQTPAVKTPPGQSD